MLPVRHPDLTVQLGEYIRSCIEDAEPLFQRALKICEKVLGPGHPHTPQSLNKEALGEGLPVYTPCAPGHDPLRVRDIGGGASGSDLPLLAARVL